MLQELAQGTVTILFTDVEGSVELATRHGDEAAQELRRALFELVRGQVEKHGGHEVKSTGDGFMLAFSSARQAVTCAIAIQRALEDRKDREPTPPLRVRMGLNTGEALQEEGDLFGAAVDAAARIMAKASGGQVLVSETVRAVLGPATDVEFVDRGRFRLKGFPERWRLYEVVWQEETSAGPALSDRTPFVGREVERAELRRCLDQVAGGHGALVMIGGEPGVGKTRLAEELMAEAQQRGMTALIGHCYEMEGAPPYIPYVEILEAAARTFAPETMRETLGDSAPEVAKLMPELRRMFPDIPPSPELPPEQERRYLFNGMRDFIARTGRNQPAVYVLDDLHWATDASLLLLQHLAQQIHEMPVLIIGTYRDVELDVARPMARTLGELTRQRLAHDITIRRLPQEGVAAMLRALSGQEPSVALVQAVHGETEGNPFFVEEVFQHLAEEGELLDAQGRWRTDLEVSELEVPRGVRLVIGQRLERVGDECRRVLTTAAVIGRRFSFELLEALSEPSPGSGQGAETDALLDAIDEAERAHLITASEGGPAQTGARPGEAHFTFAHELIRQTLVSGLSMPRRQRIHLHVAEAMERVYARSLEEHAADLAHHYYQAGAAADPDKTARYLTVAGDQALAAAAFEDALRHYEEALPLLADDDRRGRADLLYKRGNALRSVGRWDEAVADWQEALAAYEELGDAQAVGHICWEISYQLLWTARFEEAIQTAQQGLAILEERASADRCRLLACGGLSYSCSGDYDAGDPMLTQALAMAEGLGDQRLLGQVLHYKAAHCWYYGQTREQFEAGFRAVELLRSAGDLWDLANAMWYTQYALVSLGRFGEAAEIGEEAESLATRLGNLGALLCARRGTGCLEVMTTGDIDRFDEFAREDMELCRNTGTPWISNSYTYLGLADLWRGRWEEAVESFQEGARLEPPGFLAGADWASLFLGKAYAGERDSALAMLDHDRSVLPRPGQPKTIGSLSILVDQIEGLAVLGERQEAAKLYHAILKSMDMGNAGMWPGRLQQTLAGIAAACGGQWEKAEEHYQTALRQAHELPHKIEQPEVRRWYARMLIDRGAPGDREKARELLSEAIGMYRQIGMPKHVEMAERMLARAGGA